MVVSSEPDLLISVGLYTTIISYGSGIWDWNMETYVEILTGFWSSERILLISSVLHANVIS